MSSTIDYSGLTLNVEEARSSNECIFEELFIKPDTLAAVHDVQTGVDMEKFIPILGKYGLVGKAGAASCASNIESGAIPTTQKKWAPKVVNFRIPHCQDDIPDLLKFWKKSMKAAGIWEEIDSEMVAFIESRVQDATYESILRYASFGDTDATNVGAGSGSETLTAGIDAGYFTVIDGMWKQIITDGAGAQEIYRSNISENALTTKAAQLELADDTALNAMRDMYDNLAPEAFKDGNLVYEVTRNFHSNWVKFLENKSLAFMLNRAEDGATKWDYRGIPIVIRYDWDEGIKAWHDLGTTYYLPTRAILTKLSNIPIGTSDEESMKELRSFFDYKDKQWYFDVAYRIDMKILEENKIAVAY